MKILATTSTEVIQNSVFKTVEIISNGVLSKS
jgi:hypothetical protein